MLSYVFNYRTVRRKLADWPNKSAIRSDAKLAALQHNCGGIVDGLETVDEAGERIFRLMLATASGRTTKSELHGYGQNEFVPWQLGAVM